MNNAQKTAQRLPEPVGREREREILQNLYKRIVDEGGFYVVVITGPGGIGKTYLLDHLRKGWAEQGDLVVPRRLVDLYDTATHEEEGFWDSWMAAYCAVPAVAHVQQSYREKRAALSHARQAGDAVRTQQAFDDLARTLQQEWRALSRSSPWVAMLDTAERWVYPLGEEDLVYAPAWKWWLEWLRDPFRRPYNGLLILAGRPQRTQHLVAELQNLEGLHLEHIELQPFTLEESARYLQASGIDFKGEDLPRIHALTEGYPIRLTLFGYLYTRDARKARAALEKGDVGALVNVWLDTKPWTKLLPLLAVAERGLSPYMAALLDQVGDVEAATHVEPGLREELEEVANSVFLKVRPLPTLVPEAATGAYTLKDAPRYFLHDEMYAWVREVHFPSRQNRVKEWLDILAEEALKQLRFVREQLGNMYLRIAEGSIESDTSEQQIFRWEQARRQVELDRLAYLLRKNSQEGLRQYVRLIWEAHALYWDDLVRAADVEVFEYLRETVKAPWFRAPSMEERAFLRLLPQLHPVWEAFRRPRSPEEDWEYAMQRIAQARQVVDTARLRSDLRILLYIWLDVVDMQVRRRAGGDNLSAALKKAPHVKANLEKLALAAPWDWYRRWVTALLERIWAYLYRSAEEWDEADEHFRQAATLFDRLPARYEQAEALNDGGFVLLQSGQLSAGEEQIREAFTIRRRYGWALSMALSLNTLAHAALKKGDYREALSRSMQALRLFRRLGYRRGEGFAHLVISEAHRRLADEELISSREKRLEHYQQARQAAEEARAIFAHQVQDKVYEINAHDEAGRVYRQLALWYTEAGDEEKAREFERLARGAFTAAMRRAGGKQTRQGIVSWVNLFALRALRTRTVEDLSALEQEAQEILRAIEQHCPALRQVPDKKAQLSFECKKMAEQKGKTLFLLARTLLRLAVGMTDSQQRHALLRKAGARFLEALEFSRVRGEEYPALTLAREQLKADLQRLIYGEHLSRKEVERDFLAGAQERASELGLDWKSTIFGQLMKNLRLRSSNGAT